MLHLHADFSLQVMQQLLQRVERTLNRLSKNWCMICNFQRILSGNISKLRTGIFKVVSYTEPIYMI